ncbi:beta-defensin 125 [Trichechus manatus latirostris]|uniref:Beta-defensin n=1 Tax=Trichechus manatus latirostris TaxID=127582 RepID=A0A2Y9G0K5_TRIMA|nr:beta-defensin 125 [Trichechus manatus latirostris]
MNLLMLAFTICGSLTLVAKFSTAGWEIQRCWENDIGHCRKRCLQNERYKLLCKNKLTCCIPITAQSFTRRPPPRAIDTEDITVTMETYPPLTMDDFITFKISSPSQAKTTKKTSSESTVRIR